MCLMEWGFANTALWGKIPRDTIWDGGDFMSHSIRRVPMLFRNPWVRDGQIRLFHRVPSLKAAAVQKSWPKANKILMHLLSQSSLAGTFKVVDAVIIFLYVEKGNSDQSVTRISGYFFVQHDHPVSPFVSTFWQVFLMWFISAVTFRFLGSSPDVQFHHADMLEWFFLG